MIKKFYPVDYFIAMASLATSLLLVCSVLGFGATEALNLGRHEASEAVVSQGGAGTGGRLEDILGKAHKGLYDYPTSFTQGIMPRPCHSHNDYWRPVPFYTGLSVGCVSTESDVWLINGTLYVGHEQSALTKERTFEALYINPILDVLKRQNPKSDFVDNVNDKHGVFDTASGQTLYLWVDLKTEGRSTWKAVVKALEPLRSAGYLSSVNGTAISPGAVTVIGTGNTPLDLVQSVTNRDYFWDAPIPTLGSTFSNITALVSPIASTNFQANFGPVLGTGLNETQLELLREQVKTAHGKGIKLRFWNQPDWPISTRNGLWRQLISEGVDLINVDDVKAAAGFGDEW